MSEDGELSLATLNPEESSLQRELLSRREVARRLLGVTAAWSLGGLHPVWGHLLNETLFFAHADTDLASANWKPLFLAPEQNEALQSFSEAIVPGSTNALVSRFIDLLLSVETPAHQQKFLASLSAIQAERISNSVIVFAETFCITTKFPVDCCFHFPGKQRNSRIL